MSILPVTRESKIKAGLGVTCLLPPPAVATSYLGLYQVTNDEV